MPKAKLIAIIALVLLALIVVIQNASPAPVSFLFWHGRFSLALLLLVAILLGFLIGLLLPITLAHRRLHHAKTSTNLTDQST